MSTRLQITLDCKADWPIERIAAVCRILTNPLYSDRPSMEELETLNIAWAWTSPRKEAALLAYDREYDVEIRFLAGDPRASRGREVRQDLEGIRVRRGADGVIFIPLPRDLWNRFEPPLRRCGCPYCLGELGAWDTLAIPAHAEDERSDTTSVVHAPHCHTRREKLQITVAREAAIPAQRLAELYLIAVKSPQRPTQTPRAQAASVFTAEWRSSWASVWTGGTDNNGRTLFLERIASERVPARPSPHRLYGITVRRVNKQIAIPLPQALWRLEPSMTLCRCAHCQGAPLQMDTLVVDERSSDHHLLDMTRWAHWPQYRKISPSSPQEASPPALEPVQKDRL